MVSTVTPSAIVVLDEETALAVASRIALALAEGAAARDRDRSKPLAELCAIGESGLLGIAVPRDHGGPELPRRVVVDVMRRLARGDSAVAQLLLTHFVSQELLRTSGAAQPAGVVYADILREGAQLGNAFAERGGKTAGDADHRTAATRGPDGYWTVSGRKYYTTGALGSRWLAIGALRDRDPGHRVTLFTRSDAPGLDLVLDDWSSFGQRTTFSGTIIIDDLRVPDEQVLDPGPARSADELPPSIFGAYDQALHAAIDIGIARAALEDGAAFVRERGRPRPEAGGGQLADEPHVVRRFGELLARLRVLEAALAAGAQAIDEALAAPTLDDDNTAAASLAVAAVKALTQDLGVEITSAVFELAGASATDEEHGLDRHWRNTRTHSLHDPARWKYVALGNHLLHGINPPRDQLI